jgi:hypothetical protein
MSDSTAGGGPRGDPAGIDLMPGQPALLGVD